MQLEVAMASGATRVHDTLGDSFVVKAMDLAHVNLSIFATGALLRTLSRAI